MSDTDPGLRSIRPAPPAFGPLTDAPAPKPRKQRRVFMWSFLAVQALFLAWVIVGCATAHNGASATDIASQCSGNTWRVLYSSYGDCAKSVNDTMSAAGSIGTGIGLALVVGLWVAVDIILGVTRMVVVFSRRGRHQ